MLFLLPGTEQNLYISQLCLKKRVSVAREIRNNEQYFVGDTLRVAPLAFILEFQLELAGIIASLACMSTTKGAVLERVNNFFLMVTAA